jgi:hypothetical protein
MPKTGLIHTESGLPKLGIWIMPNNQDNGALEEKTWLSLPHLQKPKLGFISFF